MEEGVKIAYSNVRDPNAMKKACEEMDRRREKNRQLYGIQDVAVDIVREMRDNR